MQFPSHIPKGGGGGDKKKTFLSSPLPTTLQMMWMMNPHHSPSEETKPVSPLSGFPHLSILRTKRQDNHKHKNIHTHLNTSQGSP